MAIIIYGTGSSYAHAYYVTKVHAEKWRLDEVIIFENCSIVHCALENGADL